MPGIATSLFCPLQRRGMSVTSKKAQGILVQSIQINENGGGGVCCLGLGCVCLAKKVGCSVVNGRPHRLERCAFGQFENARRLVWTSIIEMDCVCVNGWRVRESAGVTCHVMLSVAGSRHHHISWLR